MIENAMRFYEDQKTGKRTPTPTVCGVGEPAKVYQPRLVSSLWFKTWAIQCGGCGKDFVKFRVVNPMILPLVCPYCHRKNRPNFCIVGY